MTNERAEKLGLFEPSPMGVQLAHPCIAPGCDNAAATDLCAKHGGHDPQARIMGPSDVDEDN